METKEIKLDQLIIGQNQHRTQSVGAEIDELSANIKVRGLLQPIRVVPAKSPNEGKYEIIMGQRRFLAARKLGWETIPAIISEQKEDSIEYLIDSVSENTLRKDTTTQENKDVCAILWRRFGSINAIVKMTGLTEYYVRKHVKWASLPSKLRDLVDKGEVHLDAAAKAYDVSKYDDEPDEELMVATAKKLHKLTQAQRTEVQKTKKKNREVDTKAIINKIENESQTPIIKISVTQASYETLQKRASDEKSTVDDIASEIVENAISLDRGE